MKLHDLFDMDLYAEMVHAGYIRLNRHPELPLYILNYTEHAQFDREWNPVTLQCRGLIVDQNNVIVARPFDKFFNYGEPNADVIELGDYVDVTDKMDGSLGILWQYQGQQGIATRGSFISDQAVHATKIWKKKYASAYHVPEDTTLLFEIIYPENRIVLNYGDLDDLVLLGARDIYSGSVRPPQGVLDWKWRTATTYVFKTLQEALAAPPRPNAEGYVITSRKTGGRIKVKQEDYIALHKIVTGLTKRRIWENMKNGMTLEQMCEIVPDEWHEWLQHTYWDIDTDLRGLRFISDDYFALLRQSLAVAECEGRDWERKDFALAVKDHPHRGMLFLLFDGKHKQFRDKSFDLVKPDAE